MMDVMVPSQPPTPTPPAPPAGSASAQGLLALLQEDEPMLQSHALQQLYKVVDKFWAEVAGSVPLIEELSEDPKFEVTAGSADPRPLFPRARRDDHPPPHPAQLPRSSTGNWQPQLLADVFSTLRSTMMPYVWPLGLGSTSMSRRRLQDGRPRRCSTSKPWWRNALVRGNVGE